MMAQDTAKPSMIMAADAPSDKRRASNAIFHPFVTEHVLKEKTKSDPGKKRKKLEKVIGWSQMDLIVKWHFLAIKST